MATRAGTLAGARPFCCLDGGAEIACALDGGADALGKQIDFFCRDVIGKCETKASQRPARVGDPERGDNVGGAGLAG